MIINRFYQPTIKLQVIRFTNCGHHSPYTKESLVEGFPICICYECGDIFNRFLFNGEPANICRYYDSPCISICPNEKYARCPKSSRRMENEVTVDVFKSYLENMNYPLSRILNNFKTAKYYTLGQFHSELRNRFSYLSLENKIEVLTAILDRNNKTNRV